MDHKRILIIDDEPDLTEILSIFLEEQGWSPIRAHSAEEAFEILEQTFITGVISDYRLPGMNGKELMLKVQEMLPNPPPFLFMSGDVYFGSDPVITRGAKAILPKPFDVNQVKAVVGFAFSS